MGNTFIKSLTGKGEKIGKIYVTPEGSTFGTDALSQCKMQLALAESMGYIQCNPSLQAGISDVLDTLNAGANLTLVVSSNAAGSGQQDVDFKLQDADGNDFEGSRIFPCYFTAGSNVKPDASAAISQNRGSNNGIFNFDDFGMAMFGPGEGVCLLEVGIGNLSGDYKLNLVMPDGSIISSDVFTV